MIGGRVCHRRDQVLYRTVRDGAGDFKAQQTIVIRARIQKYGARSTAALERNASEHVVRALALVIGAARQAGDSRVARSHSGAFRWQVTVGGTGTNDEPVRVVAGFLRQMKGAGERSAGFQSQRL